MGDQPIITRTRLIRDLRALGLAEGQTVMLHASVKAIGWIVGGPDVVLDAILNVLTAEGTLMMLAGCEDGTYEMAEWPEEKRQAYLAECPPFDPARTRAYRKWSILTEYLRTWPGACRSAHPDSSHAAVGRLAEWITADHPLQYGHGPGSPLAKLCQCGGKVLLLGSPLNAITLLHYAEHMASVPNKRIARYRAPILRDGHTEWVDIEEFDTCLGIVDWPDDYFITIAKEYLALGHGRTGVLAAAESYLFDAADLNRFGVEWMERHFGRLLDDKPKITTCCPTSSDDRETFRRLFADNIMLEFPDTPGWKAAKWVQSVVDLLSEKDRWALLARIGGNEAAGFALFKIDKEDRPGWGYITEFYVAREHRLKSIGKALAHEALRVLATRGVENVMLTANQNAVGFWEKCGFERSGEKWKNGLDVMVRRCIIPRGQQ